MSSEDDFPLNTRFLMAASAVFMALVGIGMATFSEQILTHFGHPAEGFAVALMKVVAGLYLGLAVLNWMARGNLIGGIYSRPVALANFAHFLAVALALLQQAPSAVHTAEIAATGAVNAVFGGAFAFVVFRGGGACG